MTMVVIKKTENKKCAQDGELLQLSHTLVGMSNGTTTLETSPTFSYKVKRASAYKPAILFVNTHPREMKT